MSCEFMWECPCPAGMSRPTAERLAESAIESVLRCDGFRLPALVCVVFTDDAHMHAVNMDMRGVDAPTDVLSFPMLRLRAGGKEAFVPHKKDVDVETGAVYLGDMVLSLERAVAQASEYGHSPERETAYLCAHSAAHLLGYDHMEDGDKQLMRALEERALAAIGLRREE